MKTIFSFCLCLCCCSLWAQTPIIQKGLVRELNSGKKPLSNTTIVFDGASSKVSDSEGRFQLVFQNKKRGELIFKQEIYRKGYELVNEKDFDIVRISTSDQLGVDIILAPFGTVDAAKKEYYDVSDKALLAGFNKERSRLKKKLQAAEIKEAEFEEALGNLREQYDYTKRSLGQARRKICPRQF